MIKTKAKSMVLALEIQVSPNNPQQITEIMIPDNKMTLLKKNSLPKIIATLEKV